MITSFKIGQRVQLHPATDTWMRGDRYGEVVKIGRLYIHVKLDKSDHVLRFRPDNLLPLD